VGVLVGVHAIFVIGLLNSNLIAVGFAVATNLGVATIGDILVMIGLAGCAFTMTTAVEVGFSKVGIGDAITMVVAVVVCIATCDRKDEL
jgi:hypothetical protein